MESEVDTPPRSPAALQAAAAVYAPTVDLDVPVDALTWEISHRAKRQAGRLTVSLTSNGEVQNPTITLSWAAHDTLGWEQTKATIRHELIHLYEFCEYGETSHETRFQTLADRLDCGVTCEQFVEPRYQLHCLDCDRLVTAKHSRSKSVKAPELYSCSSCEKAHAQLQVTDIKTEATWTTWQEFTQIYDDVASLVRPYRYAVVCEPCDRIILTRQRQSKYVAAPERYGCPRCTSVGTLLVHDHKTGRQWHSNAERVSKGGATAD